MSRRWVATVAVVVAALAAAANAGAATYYVSPSGSDSASGLASSSAWRTVGKVSNASLQPGDTVLFQGGATYSGALMPGQSGTASAPITFGSFGGGQANVSGGIWFSQKSYLTFDGLQVDAGSSPGDLSAIQASASGSGSTGIVIKNCTLSHVRIGINSANANDAGWTISNNLIQSTRDSGVIVQGHDFSFVGNSILDTGQDASISYGKHGVYAKGSSLSFVGNTIRRFSADGISLRFRNARVVGNTISDGPIGVAWFQQDTQSGSTTIAYNRITATSDSGIYISPSDSAGTTTESFVLANNTIQVSAGNGLDLNRTSGGLTLANNTISGAAAPVAHLHSPGGAYSEHHDSFWTTSGSPQVDFNGTSQSVASYRASSGQGAADLASDPQLASDLAPGATSPLVAAGSTGVAGVTFTASCDGAPFHYCGTAPNIGAVDSLGSTPPPPPPPPPVSALAPPTNVHAAATTQTSVSLAWTAPADARVVSYAVVQDGTALFTPTTPAITISGLTCGTTSTYDVRSVDASGGMSDAASIKVSTLACPPPPPVTDTTPPWVLITSPTMNMAVPLTTTVKVDATDASGIKNVTFWVDSVTTCVDTAAPFTCGVTMKNGNHTLLVRATDNAGNIAWMSVKVTASSKLH